MPETIPPEPAAGRPASHQSPTDDRDSVARMVVARSFSNVPLPLGLDAPLELRGGGNLSPSALALQLPLYWVPDVIARVAAACRRQSIEGRRWFAMPPVALSGPDGLGRTHIARTIARQAGVPFASFDIGGPRGADPMMSWNRSPDIPMPSSAVLAMAASRCANPLILVTGVDDATPEAAEALASMIARESTTRWVDEGLEAVVDLGQVSWLIQTADATNLPPSFPADMHVVRLDRPDQGQASLLALSLLAEVAADLQLPVNGLARIVEHIVDFVTFYGGTPVSGLHRAIMAAVIEFEADGR